MTRSEFEHILPSLRPLILQMAQDFFGSHDDAEDATQEALLRLWHYCERIDVERNVEGLAVRVAKHCCVSMSRQSRQRPIAPVDERAVALSPSPHELLEAQDARAMLTEVIDRLQPRERSLFEMRRLEGIPLDEIVARTGIAKASVKVMISAARKKVFTELKQRMKQ